MAISSLAEINFRQIQIELNDYGVQLAGIEDILDNGDLGGDARYVAAIVCRQINRKLCELGDMLGRMAQEGGAA